MPSFVAVRPAPGLLALPWETPLEDWPAGLIVALPRGISRHVVRFVRVDGSILACKEIAERTALREHALLRDLNRLNVPCVQPVGVVRDRTDSTGEPLDAILLTAHLPFSLPYRAVFSNSLREETVLRLIDALVVLIVRLHLDGFAWGDCSLSNTLFRRDADSFAAFLVDAETGDLHDRLSNGQRAYDVDLARTNIFGELLDLQAGEVLDEETDLLGLVDRLVSRYESLWAELTAVEEFDASHMYRLEARVRRLNDLGFDVAELDIVTDVGGRQVRIQPKVVDAGHHARRLLRLTGLDVEENQARRLLNDLDAFRARTDQQNLDESIAAHQWLTEVFEPVVQAVPRELRGRLDAAQLYHEVLEHRWYASERAGREVPMDEVVASYVDEVLRDRPDEVVTLLDPTAIREEDSRTY
ncbi:MAG TPA: DUF4032 domain-containing protein [Actinopolymorphaceae bacterium]|jgi:hypothetical protein